MSDIYNIYNNTFEVSDIYTDTFEVSDIYNIYNNTFEVSDISKPQFENLKNMQNLSLGIKNCLSGYTKAINKQENRTGSLFRQKTKSKRNFIDGFTTVNDADFFEHENAYAAKCFDYIHLNPVKE